MKQGKSELHRPCSLQIIISKSFSDTGNPAGTIGGSQTGPETITVNDIRRQASQLEATDKTLDVLLNQTASD